MIHPQELRIGNLVNKIVSNNTFLEKMHNVVASDLYDDECEWFEPIPISEELLLKCGFERELDGFFRINGSSMIEVFFHDRGIQVTTDSVCLDHVQFIHQVQNFYFAHKNEELQINL